MARTETEVGAGVGVRVGEVQDFISRYMRGGGSGGISGEEALRHYDIIVGHLTPEEFEEAATAAFERMTPDQREQLAHLLDERGHQQGYQYPELSNANTEQFRDARQLARIVCSLEAKDEGLFRQMMTDGGEGGLGSLTREGESLLRHTLFKASVGGIAAMALQRLIRTIGTPEGRPAEHP